MKKGGTLHYATCSVFEIENEKVVTEIASEVGMQITGMRYIKGYENRGDSFFVAELQY